jgi:nuclear pore complex protein Nup155
MLDLMWKYYEKQRNFSGAARILVKLADKNTVDLTLQQRVEYLARASLCAKCVTSNINTPGDGDFLHEVEDKLEVCFHQLFFLLRSLAIVQTRSNDVFHCVGF